jgi:hypothetical protein
LLNSDPEFSRVLLMVGVMFVLLTMCAAWMGYRLVAAIAATRWMLGRLLPDGRWGAIVIAYETAFLWAPLTALFLLLLSYQFAGGWITGITNEYWARRTFGMPAEPAAAFGLIGLFGIAWLWRYSRIVGWIRWSNY